MDRDMLIQYVDILNKMENMPYDVQMGHNDLDSSIIHFVEKSAEDDEELNDLIVLLKSLSCEERVSYIKDYLNQKEAVASNNREEEEISKVFGVNVSDIQHLFLENGNEIFAFYDTHTGKDVVLGNQKNGKSLIEQLESIQKEDEKYQDEDASENAHSILIDESTRNNLQLSFYTKEEISKHSDEVEQLTSDDRRKLDYLLIHYTELDILGINLSNMIYLDHDGEIHEVAIDLDSNLGVVKPGSYDYQASAPNESVGELDQMVSESNPIIEQASEENNIKKSSEKAKVYVMKDYSDDDYGFTNNALYFFLILFGVLFLIFFLLYVFVL